VTFHIERDGIGCVAVDIHLWDSPPIGTVFYELRIPIPKSVQHAAGEIQAELTEMFIESGTENNGEQNE
jgi:hypothetical protein